MMTKFNEQDSAKYNQVAGQILKSNPSYEAPKLPRSVGTGDIDYVAEMIKGSKAGPAAKDIVSYAKNNDLSLFDLMKQASLELKLNPVLEKAAASIPAQLLARQADKSTPTISA